jgi:hypothetical protein
VRSAPRQRPLEREQEEDLNEQHDRKNREYRCENVQNFFVIVVHGRT